MNCLPRALRTRVVTTALLQSILAATTWAQTITTSLVTPGRWEITPQSNAGASISYQLCFTKGDLDDLKKLLPNLSDSADCPPQRVAAANGIMTWKFSCPAKSFRGEGSYQLTAATIEGAINFTQGDPAVTTRHSIAARHLGGCPSR